MIISLPRLAVVGLLAIGAGCAAQPAAVQPAGPPRLVVFIPIDGFPQRQFAGYRDQFAPGGFLRFLDHGAWFSDALQGHSHATTAPGHAVMLSGAYPHRSGIIANDWRDPVTSNNVYCTFDPDYKLIGAPTTRNDGTSPRNLKVETVGDVLRGANDKSRVIAVSAKDRGAILTAGHRGTAYMYQASTGQFSSSTYYMQAHPEWVERFNAAKRADGYFHAQWKPLLEDAAYARSQPDRRPWYQPGGWLPKVMGEGMAAPGPKFYDELLASPFADEMAIAFAQAAVEGERLGDDDAPDILIVSLKGHDFVNHRWSAESRLSHDHALRLDRMLAGLFAYLDEKVGRDNYVAVLTTDHGFTPAPEQSRLLGRDAGRQSMRSLLAKLNGELAKTFDTGNWIRGWSGDTLVLDKALVKERGVDLQKLTEETRRLLLLQPSMEAAYTRAEILGGTRQGAPWFDRVQRAFNAERSGDVQFVIKRYWIISGSSTGTSHGSPHPEDTNVPIAFYGPRWIKPGLYPARVETVDIAPTVARLLGVRAPSASEGKVLPILATQ